jgi:hypothetical protein
MPHPPALKASLKRGAFVAAANWPLIAVQFIAEGTQQLLLAVPVVGGIVLVVLLLGADVEDMMSGDMKSTSEASSARSGQPGSTGAFAASTFQYFWVRRSDFVVGGTGSGSRGRGIPGWPDRASTPSPCRTAARQPDEHRAIPLGMPKAGRALHQAGHVPADRLRHHRSRLPGICDQRLRFLEQPRRAAGMDVRSVSGAQRPRGLDHDCEFLLPAHADGHRRRRRRRARRNRRVAQFIRTSLREVAGILASCCCSSPSPSGGSLLASTGLALIAVIPFVGLAMVPLNDAWMLRGIAFEYLA